MKVKFNDFIKESSYRKREIDQAINRVLFSGWYILGPQVVEFEQQFASYVGRKYCIGVGNGLDALRIALMALGVGKNDEVITTPLSAVATTLAIMAVGARPIFVDTDKKGLITADNILPAITKKTRAVIPVHLYGQPLEAESINSLCHKRDLFLIEDAAQAHGTTLHGKKAGSFGCCGCFSFYPTKNLGAVGDGGAIVVNNKILANTCRQIRDYGQTTKYIHTKYGLNSRLDELQAAILKVKLAHLNEDNQLRKRWAETYIKGLSDLPLTVITDNLLSNNFHLFVIRSQKRDALQKYLKEKGIATLVHYPTIIPEQPFLKHKYQASNFPNAKVLSREVLSLPCHPFMNQLQIREVIKSIHGFYNQC